jgi:AcrR family transcriptional regulator
MKKAGRPLSFNRQKALEKAMLTFWQSGYETTSITDLTTAMGITAPSLYTAFGDKKKLFIEAINLYAFGDGVGEDFITNAVNSYEAAQMLLNTSLIIFTDEKTPAGCLMASSTATGSAASLEVRQYVSSIRASMREALSKRIERDITENKLPSSVSANALSHYIFAVIQGMSVLARDGESKFELQQVANIAMQSWPLSAKRVD